MQRDKRSLREEALSDERDELIRIGIALSSTLDVDRLLEMILAKTRQITGADAGSLYMVEKTGSENGLSGRQEKSLRFRLVQNDSRQFPYVEHSLPFGEDSMAGYTALHGEVVILDDVYHIPPERPYHFNPVYDQETNYRTRSLLTVPMKNARGEVLGVMQLLNRKRNQKARLLTPDDVEREVEPFPLHSVRLAESLASQAIVAFENSQLYRNVQTLFDGFVKAAVTAIEQRDPSTSGHSMRVAAMTLKLAEAVNAVDQGQYADVHFTPDQIKELRYAALLHDFGKIAVREEVLVKAKKLYPAQLTMIEQRFEYLFQQLATVRAEKKLAAVLSSGPDAAQQVRTIDEDYLSRKATLTEWLRLIIEVNDQSMLSEIDSASLSRVASETYEDSHGVQQSLLTNEERASLLIRQGSLNNEERLHIESHVMHSFNFLSEIPWTPELKYIPWIVRAHHEKGNGWGYPFGLTSEEIPLQAKLIIICDIFDALCAADRPYKKAIPRQRAFEILESAVERNELDRELFRIFMDARIFDLISEPQDQHLQEECKLLDLELGMLDSN